MSDTTPNKEEQSFPRAISGTYNYQAKAILPAGTIEKLATTGSSGSLNKEDKDLKRHELSEMLKGKDLRALLSWVYDHGQLNGALPQQLVGKDFVLKAAEKAVSSRDQQIALAARIEGAKAVWGMVKSSPDIELSYQKYMRRLENEQAN